MFHNRGSSVELPRLWVPSDMPGLVVRYDASAAAGVSTSSGLVTQFNDSSSAGRILSASGTARPTYVSAYQNGLNAIQFDGVNNVMNSAISFGSNAGVGLSGDADLTIVAIYKPTSLNKGSLFGWGDYGSSDRCCGFFEDNTGTALAFGGAHGIITNHSNDDVVNIRSFVKAPGAYSNGESYLNGVADSTSKTTGTPNLDGSKPLYLGQWAEYTAARFEGYFFEMFICNDDADTDSIRKAEGFLAHKWGATDVLDAGHPYKNSAPRI